MQHQKQHGEMVIRGDNGSFTSYDSIENALLQLLNRYLVSHVFHHRQPTFSGSIAESGCLLNHPAGSILNRHVKKLASAHRMGLILAVLDLSGSIVGAHPMYSEKD